MDVAAAPRVVGAHVCVCACVRVHAGGWVHVHGCVESGR